MLISGTEVGKRVAQHKAVIVAAKEANVKLFVYTSILKSDTSPLALASEHKATESLIKDSGLANVILRNGWYHENYTEALDIAIQSGAIVGAAGQGKFATAA